ncbi:MAG TPA: carboxypeptidase-like regulatory domain-containing protein [Gemmatimonadales bacterium]|nr:carboxypeptidase-like regulatory domain-containing protein [Gemmatimonadales bacterium]
MTVIRRAIVAAASLLFIAPCAAQAQGDAEIVRGQVVDPQRAPIQGVLITVTGGLTHTVRHAQTDRGGHYSILFLDRESNYTVVATRVGYSPALTRASRSGLTNIITVDLILAAAPFALAPLVVRDPGRGSRGGTERSSIGGVDQDLLSAEAFVDDPADLIALIQLTPGIFAIGDSNYSVLGAPADQNSTLLDGMRFDGALLPPDAACGIRVATTTSDPSRGQFAGGQTSITSCRGGDLFESTIRGTLRDPALAWGDAASPTAPPSAGTLSGFISGALRTGVAHYRLSFSATDRVAAVASLTSPRGNSLTQLGVATDTLSALMTALASLGVPTGINSSTQQRQQAAAFLTVDWNPRPSTSWIFTASGSATAAQSGIGPLTYPSVTSRGTAEQGRFMARGSTLVLGAVDELTGVLSATGGHSLPSLALPSADVLVGTTLAGQEEGLTVLRFGGSSNFTRTAATQADVRNQISWLGGGDRQWFFGQELDLDQTRSATAFDTLGAFSYLSIANVGTNQPASYLRTTATAPRSGSAMTGALWLGTIWRASNAISFQGGLRLDVERFGDAAAYNPTIDSEFHRRTNHLPSDLAFSPRVGFAWLVKSRGSRVIRDSRTGRTMIQDFTDPGLVPGMPRANIGGGVTLIGDIGAYRGVINPARVTALGGQTGLASSTRVLDCVGDATPVPQWSDPAAAVFDTCRNGTTPSAFAANQAVVAVMAPGFRPPVDWKANVGLTGLYWGDWAATAAVVLKHGVNYPDRVDLNFSPTSRFMLREEGNRPVYADPANIVAATGAIGAGASRINPVYGSVTDLASDLTSDAAQLDVTLYVPPRWHLPSFKLEYSGNLQRYEQRGFAASTAGDPSTVESARGAQPVHQLVITPASLHWGPATLGVRLNVMSGAAYTPVVVGDVNGDGLGNDRAFVVDPAVVADTALGRGIGALLAAAPASARQCLQGQLGRIAAPESCRGPWQMRLDLTFDLAEPTHALLGNRLHLSARFLNAGAALMRLAGVSSALAQGNPEPDNRLLFVTGFDPVAQEFVYKVNPVFGQPLNIGAGTSHFPPFELQVGVEYQLSRPSATPYLHSIGLAPEHKPARSAADDRAALERHIPDFVDTLLVHRDSLALTDEQAARIAAIDSVFRHALDSLVAPLVVVVRQRGASVTDRDMSADMARWFAAVQPIRSDAWRQALGLLLPAQKTKLEAILGRAM